MLVSKHGVPGALGFSAAALALAARDAFIGWDAATHVRRLHRVPGMRRCLIRPCGQCGSLASKALSLALRLPVPRPLPGLGAGLAADSWAEQEFGGSPLGDAPLSRRLVRSVWIQSRAPASSFPAAVRGYYWMIDQPADSEARLENIPGRHRERTLQRMRGQETVLCIQDGTDLHCAEHPGCAGWAIAGGTSA